MALLATRRGWGAPGIGMLLTGFGIGAAAAAFRGRVGSVTTLLNLGVVPLTMAAMGAVVGVVGLRAAFVLCGAVEVVGLLCLLSRGFRTVHAAQ